TRRLEALVFEAVPEAVSSVTSVASTGRDPGESFRGEIRLTLRPAGQRERSNSAIAADLRQLLEGRRPGREGRARAPEGQFLLGRVLGTTAGSTVEARGHDLDPLDALARRAAEVVETVPGVTDVDLSREAGVP